MAALLRSARLLKFSPSGLLQTTGIKRTGLPLSRLYSGALGGGRTGGCSRQISHVSENASSLVRPYAVGCVRNYAVATEQKDEAGNRVRSKQMQQFDRALVKLDSSVRRTGRITKTLLLNIFHDLCRTGYPSSNQALLLLRSCGSLLPEVPLEERTELAHRVWDKMQELGAQYDVSHYNAILKVYLQNDFKFSPTDFLAKMETAKVQPNRVTYQRLIAAYCQKGDIEGASTILGFMKSNDLAITEAVFNSLVTGHARAGDMESAKNILPVMRRAGMEPRPDTYVSLLNAYAEKGDMDSMKEVLAEADSADCRLMDRDIMEVIFTLAKAGHQEHVQQFIDRLRHEIGYVPDAMNLCLSLITHGQDETAFKVLKTFRQSLPDSTNSTSNLGSFFLRHCVNMDRTAAKIVSYCKELQEANMHSAPLSFALSCALEAKKTEISLELMKLMKDQDLPVRPHYFWPLLSHHVKENNAPAVLKVVRGMQELGMPNVVETICTQVVRFFPNIEAAQQAFKDANISLDSEDLLYTEICLLALHNLPELHTRLSDPAIRSLDLTPIRNNLIAGFRRSDDVESMVKIVELFHNEKRFTETGNNSADGVSYFLYSLINSMPMSHVQAQEDKLERFFKQLKAQNVTISTPAFKGIRNLLLSYKTPRLIKDVSALEAKENGVSDEPVPAAPRAGGKVQELERQLAEMKAQDKPVGPVLKSLILALNGDDNLPRALELKQQYEEEMTAGSYATLITLCCRHNNVEEALNLKREMSCKDSSMVLTSSKYLQLVRVFATNDKEEEAVDILKEMKEKEVVLHDADTAALFHLLTAVAVKGAMSTVQRLLDTVFTLGLAKLTSNLCSPVVSAYLERKDVSSALEAALDYQRRFNVMPRIHDIIVELVERGDAELLQKALDFMSHKRGDMNMLYTLFFAFVQTGRYREAQKIIETPGFRARNGNLQWFSEKCIFNNQMEALEQIVDMTAKLFGCDRDEMYSYLLRLCKETNDWKKAEAVWTKMQEENVIPRERTLRLLADILRNNGQEVPFEVPEIWYENVDPSQQDRPGPEPTTTPKSDTFYHQRLVALGKKGKAEEAFQLLEEVEKKGVALDPLTYDQLIRALLSMGSLDEAMAVKNIALSHKPDFELSNIAFNLLIITYSMRGQINDGLEKLSSMIELNHVPSHLCITKLVNAMGQHGDLTGIQEVESVIKALGTDFNPPPMVFINNTAIAHIKKGDVESAVELLEGLFTNPDSRVPSMSFIFKKVLEDGDGHALDKLSAMAERLANHFACYKPACDLFLQLLDMDKVEDAKFMLARCNAVAEQTPALLSYVAKRAQRPGQVGKIQNLLSLIPGCIEKELVYSYTMKCHATDNDLTSAKALYEQMQEEGIAIDELSLKRLAVLYRKAGETVPFAEPPESFKFYADKLRAQAAKTQETDEE